MAAKKETAAAAPAVSDKKKALETAMQQIEKMYGKGSIMRYGDGTGANVEAIPTGSLALDLALGIGGGAAAFLAASMQMPITAVALVMEFTHMDHSYLAPTLLCAAGAFLTCRILDKNDSF